MRLNLKHVINVPGAVAPFEFTLDLSHLDFYGRRPVCEPLVVSGEVRNHADTLVLSAVASTNLHLVCDRCLKEYQRQKTLTIDTMLATELENDENDEIILLEGQELDVGEVVSTAFILDMDTKNLCSDDCKGLCSVCGADLNLGPCKCRPEVDPRLAKLAQLLDNQ